MSFNYFISFPRKIEPTTPLYKQLELIPEKKIAKKAFRNAYIYAFNDLHGGWYGNWHYISKLQEYLQNELKNGEVAEAYRQWGGKEKATLHMSYHEAQKYYENRIIGHATQKLTITVEDFFKGNYPSRTDERLMLILVKDWRAGMEVGG